MFIWIFTPGVVTTGCIAFLTKQEESKKMYFHHRLRNTTYLLVNDVQLVNGTIRTKNEFCENCIENKRAP